MQTELLCAMQSRVARIAVSASTVRGKGNSGVVAASRKSKRGQATLIAAQ